MNLQPAASTQPNPPHGGQQGYPATPPGGSPVARRKTSRIPFLVGFVIGFALLALGSCSAAWFGLGFNQITLAQLTGDDVAWTAPTLVPTSTPAPVAETVVLESGGLFSAGEIVRNATASRVNLRSTPGHLGKGGDDVLGQLAAGDAVVVQGESTVVDNLTWWRVTWQGLDGWVAEATASGVQILGE